MSSTAPEFEYLLPHRTPMLMLSSVVQQDEHSIHCTSIVKTQNPLLIDNHFPALAGLELLAQASGVMLSSGEAGHQPRPGVIARIRSLQLHETVIPVGAELHIHASFSAGNLQAALVKGHVLFNEQTFCRGSMMLATLTDTVL